jgi:hypothetical protein
MPAHTAWQMCQDRLKLLYRIGRHLSEVRSVVSVTVMNQGLIIVASLKFAHEDSHTFAHQTFQNTLVAIRSCQHNVWTLFMGITSPLYHVPAVHTSI